MARRRESRRRRGRFQEMMMREASMAMGDAVFFIYRRNYRHGWASFCVCAVSYQRRQGRHWYRQMRHYLNFIMSWKRSYLKPRKALYQSSAFWNRPMPASMPGGRRDDRKAMMLKLDLVNIVIMATPGFHSGPVAWKLTDTLFDDAHSHSLAIISWRAQNRVVSMAIRDIEAKIPVYEFYLRFDGIFFNRRAWQAIFVDVLRHFHA